MLIELLCRSKLALADAAFRAKSSGTTADSGHNELATIRRRLLHVVDGSQVPFEDVGTIECLFIGRPSIGAKGTHHCALVMRKGMSVLVIFASKALGVVLACLNGAFFGAFFHMRQHVGGKVLEYSTTLGMRAAVSDCRHMRGMGLFVGPGSEGRRHVGSWGALEDGVLTRSSSPVG